MFFQRKLKLSTAYLRSSIFDKRWRHVIPIIWEQCMHAWFSNRWLGGMVTDYKNTQLSCRLHADPPWQFCEWCQPELYLNFNPFDRPCQPGIDRQQRLAPAVSSSRQTKSSARIFNSGVNRSNHADSCPNEIGKAEEFLLLIFWISSCGFDCVHLREACAIF